ncbi:unnamed protein product [Cylicocyclus nassatus]|uniref:Uncharacterized protein n=1 Tax=Cylicocyclus nassatus TaxID=53992 RepID=A0AA36HD13_CYLNA|nr:unnamed protein product [Cylicocyclus nassatus]
MYTIQVLKRKAIIREKRIYPQLTTTEKVQFLWKNVRWKRCSSVGSAKRGKKQAGREHQRLPTVKKYERQHYWDVQTSSSANKWKKLPAKYTKPDPYPVALIHGQYQNYYRKFTASKLRRLPLESVLDGEHLFPVHRDPSPPPINVSEKDMQRFEKLLAAQGTPIAAPSSGQIKMEMTTPRAEPARKSSGSSVRNNHRVSAKSILTPQKCSSCDEVQKPGEVFIRYVHCTQEEENTALLAIEKRSLSNAKNNPRF